MRLRRLLAPKSVSPMMSSLSAVQFIRNAESRGGWERYRSHRERVTGLLMKLATDAATSEDAAAREICILGAGNCNDIDLRALLDLGLRVHLVDLDGDALTAGLRAQGVADSAAIELHAGVDVTGVFAEIAKLNAASSEADVRELARRLVDVRGFEIARPCRFVASIGLLTQLIETVLQTLGDQHAALIDLIQAVRAQHLRVMFDLLAPGGSLLLTTEIVSSSTAPEIATIDESRLPELLGRLFAQRNFFTGLHPGIVMQTFQLDPVVSPQLRQLTATAPWRWEFLFRTYAVCGFVAEKNG